MLIRVQCCSVVSQNYWGMISPVRKCPKIAQSRAHWCSFLVIRLWWTLTPPQSGKCALLWIWCLHIEWSLLRSTLHFMRLTFVVDHRNYFCLFIFDYFLPKVPLALGMLVKLTESAIASSLRQVGWLLVLRILRRIQHRRSTRGKDNSAPTALCRSWDSRLKISLKLQRVHSCWQ